MVISNIVATTTTTTLTLWDLVLVLCSVQIIVMWLIVLPQDRQPLRYPFSTQKIGIAECLALGVDGALNGSLHGNHCCWEQKYFPPHRIVPYFPFKDQTFVF